MERLYSVPLGKEGEGKGGNYLEKENTFFLGGDKKQIIRGLKSDSLY